MLWPLAAAAADAYKVELSAPSSVKKLLTQHLDLFRYKNRDDIDEDQLNFMVATVPRQVERLTSTEGYFSPKTTVTTDTESGKTVIRVEVDPGPRTVVSTVDIDIAGAANQSSSPQAAEVRQKWPLQPGEPFRQEDWSAAKDGGLQILQRRRYPAAKIAKSAATINADRQAAELAVRYDSGPAFMLGELEISGTSRYPEQIVRNVNPLKPGEEYSADRLLEFQRQVLRTPYFSNAVIDVDTAPGNAEGAPVRVRVTEFPMQRVRGGAGFTTDTGAQVEGLYSHYDMFDRAWVLNAQTRLEQRRQFMSLELAMPPGRGAWVNSGNGSVERTTLEGVDLRSRRLGVRRGRSTDKRDTIYSLEYYRDELQQLSGATLPPDTVVAPGAHQALVTGVELTRRQVDNPLFPRDGRIVSFQGGVALKGLLTDQTFFRFYGRLREFLPVGKRDHIVLRAEAGAVVSKGGNASIPASLLFRAGGTESVRGYAYRSIGNERDGTVYPTRYLATGGVEYVHWLKENWGGAVFYDAGVATDRWSDRSLFHAVGAGVRFRSPVGRLNADLAYGIQANRIRPHLSLGVAF